MAGLIPVKSLSGSPVNARVSRYRKEASVILGIHDAVVLTGTSSIAGTNGAEQSGIPLVTRAAAASGTITGVVVGFEHDLSSSLPPAHKDKFMAAADMGMVLVVDDPSVLIDIEEDADTTPLAVTDVGEGVDLATITNADTYTGYSTMKADSSTAAGGSADQLQILEINYPLTGSTTVAIARCRINEHTYAGAGTMI